MSDILYKIINTGKVTLQKLHHLRPTIDDASKGDALSSSNKAKNRNSDLIPGE